MKLPDVPPVLPTPRYDDKVVQDIQLKMDTDLSWLTKSYHIARVGIYAKDGLTYPQIQANNATGEVYNISPDNECAAYSFWEVDRPYVANSYEGTLTCYLSVIVWGNLYLINPALTTDFTGNLIKDVVSVLRKKGADNVTVEENPEKIFSKYTALKQQQKQHLIRKYTGFKISFEILTGLHNEC